MTWQRRNAVILLAILPFTILLVVVFAAWKQRHSIAPSCQRDGSQTMAPKDSSSTSSATPDLSQPAKLLTDPFLQNPQPNSVCVVWFTEFEGNQHWVIYGARSRSVKAKTTKLSRMREDQQSVVNNHQGERIAYEQITPRSIWRHEALIDGLKPGDRLEYYVVSQFHLNDATQEVRSDVFTLQPAPQPQDSLRILLTSDHQLKPMVAANLQKVVETVGQVDAVFLAGDLVNIPDRASEWFDNARGSGFFPALQGRANCRFHYNTEKKRFECALPSDPVEGVPYQGGALIQSAPLFPAIGNHEVMGRFAGELSDESSTNDPYRGQVLPRSLNEQFNDPIPRSVAEAWYQEIANTINPENDLIIQQNWIRDHSFNTMTVEEIFSLPCENLNGPCTYYAVTFGDIRLVVLYATNIWRNPYASNYQGRYLEQQNQVANRGYGQHIFEPIHQGSQQYEWLKTELESDAFQQAKYRIVMLHHPIHSLGDNVVPAYTNPIELPECAAQANNPDNNQGNICYDYPLKDDYLHRDIVPLLEKAGVQLVLNGHSHLWNRFFSNGIHFLETSNVGNTYGAFWQGNKLRQRPDWKPENYVLQGDPYGLDPIVPTIAPLIQNDDPLPYIASNEITVFSILETATGTVSSYYFETLNPDSEVVLFDRFCLIPDSDVCLEVNL